MSNSGAPTEQALVITDSPGLRRRITTALESMRVAVDHVTDSERLRRHRRNRPFLLCFVDARDGDGVGRWGDCLRARPAERYVVVMGAQQRPREEVEGAALGGGEELFGYLREPFGKLEVRVWARRAAEEAKHRRGDQSLEDLLYGRFRHFLQDLGSQPIDSLHELVWERVERPLISAVLESTGGNQSRAAEILGIHRNTLRTKIRTLNIDPGRWSGSR